jgi:hypothetical protein
LNYLAHSLPFVDDDDVLGPWRVAGTSLPDWLRVVDRQARLRPAVLALAPRDDPRFVAMIEGAQRHHDDDLRFHSDDAFDALSHELAAEIRGRFPDQRASALGHVLVEMLVDAALMQQRPGLLDRFYAQVDVVDDDVVGRFVRAATGRPVDHAELFLQRFKKSRFLAYYATDPGLRDCLQGVWTRTGIGALPDGFVDVVGAARVRVLPLVQSFFA